MNFLFTIFLEDVIATSGTGGTNIELSFPEPQLCTAAIRASSSDKTAKNVDSIFKSFSDNSSLKLNRTAPEISFALHPIALRTWLGAGLFVEQADPVET